MKKPDLIGYIIPHHIILDYFNYANENKIREKVALIGEHIHEFLHTREGSRIAMMCFSYGTAKVCYKKNHLYLLLLIIKFCYSIYRIGKLC